MIIKVKKVEDFSNYDKSVFNSLNRFLNSNTIKVDEIKEQIEDCNNQISETIDLLCGYIKSGNRKFYESFNAPDKAVQLEKLLESPYIESAQFQDDNLVIVTKPLKVWKWNWGQYIISYNIVKSFPEIKRISNKDLNSIVKPYAESEFLVNMKAEHPHVLSRPCFGKAEDLIKTFWIDYSKGFNYCIQYLLTYNRDGAYIRLPYFLALLGYIKDASILMKDGDKIAYISDGKFYNKEWERIYIKDLEALGCNGKISSEKQIRKIIEKSRFTKKAKALRENVRYLNKVPKELKHTESREFDVRCVNCSDGVTTHYRLNGNYYCRICYEEIIETCYKCGNIYEKERIKEYEGINGKICTSCYRLLTFVCSNCAKRFPNVESHYSDIGDLCTNCFTQYEDGEEEEEEFDEDDIIGEEDLTLDEDIINEESPPRIRIIGVTRA